MDFIEPIIYIVSVPFVAAVFLVVVIALISNDTHKDK